MADTPQFGVPWHGKVLYTNQLQLSDSTLKDGWIAPGGEAPVDLVGTREYEHAGYNYYQKKPGIAAVVRSAAQALRDTANGHEWRNDFLIRGSGPAYFTGSGAAFLFTKSINGWIYFADDGSRWLVPLLGQSFWGTPPPTVAATGISLNFTVSRFGQFGAAAETHDFAISKTAAEIGQSSPFVSFGGANYLFAQVEDITPGGDKAIMALWLETNGVRASCGFLEIALAGTPGVDFLVSVTVLKSRADVLGTYTCINTITTTHPTGATVTAGDVHSSITGRIIAMQYDAAGVAQPITFSYTGAATLNTTDSLTGTDSSTLTESVTFQVDGYGASVSTTATTTYSSDGNTSTASITFDGGTYNNDSATGALMTAPVSVLSNASLSAASLLYYGYADWDFVVQTPRGGTGALLSIKRWSNNLLGVYARGVNSLPAAGSGYTLSYLEAHLFSSGQYQVIKPDGTTDGPVTLTGGRHAMYGSYNPLTGDYVMGSLTRVNWA